MKWTTTIQAIDPITGKLLTWSGPLIEALTWRMAEYYCQNNGLGYCKVNGRLIAEIPCTEEGKADFKGLIDYDIIQLN